MADPTEYTPGQTVTLPNGLVGIVTVDASGHQIVVDANNPTNIIGNIPPGSTQIVPGPVVPTSNNTDTPPPAAPAKSYMDGFQLPQFGLTWNPSTPNMGIYPNLASQIFAAQVGHHNYGGNDFGRTHFSHGLPGQAPDTPGMAANGYPLPPQQGPGQPVPPQPIPFPTPAPPYSPYTPANGQPQVPGGGPVSPPGTPPGNPLPLLGQMGATPNPNGPPNTRPPTPRIDPPAAGNTGNTGMFANLTPEQIAQATQQLQSGMGSIFGNSMGAGPPSTAPSAATPSNGAVQVGMPGGLLAMNGAADTVPLKSGLLSPQSPSPNNAGMYGTQNPANDIGGFRFAGDSPEAKNYNFLAGQYGPQIAGQYFNTVRDKLLPSLYDATGAQPGFAQQFINTAGAGGTGSQYSGGGLSYDGTRFGTGIGPNGPPQGFTATGNNMYGVDLPYASDPYGGAPAGSPLAGLLGKFAEIHAAMGKG